MQNAETTLAATRWQALEKGRKARPFEWLAEKAIFLVALSAIAMVFVIFIFVAREALPVILGRTNSSTVFEVIPVEQLDKTPPDKLRAYLGMTVAEYAKADHDTLKALMEVKADEAKESKGDLNAKVNATTWRNMILPRQWDGLPRPEYIWEPVADAPKFNIMPLVVGSLKTTLVALIFSIPVSLAAAIYVSQLASPRFREWAKPIIELLAGIPSVVLGFFCLIVLASILQSFLGYRSRLNAFVAGVGLAFAVIPVIFSIAEDALSSVPPSYLQAALALGSSRWMAAWKVVLPAAMPGVFAAIILGFGRAIGETMVVLMASGSARIMSWNLFDSTKSITNAIAAELGEAVTGGDHYRILFLIGALLFVVTFVSNLAGELVMHRLKGKMEGRR
jgi:phosphate transport system permease protein